MANGPMPLVGLCALYLLCAGCSSDHDSEVSSAGTSSVGGGTQPDAGGTGGVTSAAAGTVSSGGGPGSAGAVASAGKGGSSGSPGEPSSPANGGGASGGPPPAVDGQSVYALECHGDSKDCNLASVPCFGVASNEPNVAAGWSCANRCASNADCSDAASGAEAEAACVSFSSASHCMLVCQNENQSFACPNGMSCYVPKKSPIGYCLWQ